MQKSTDIVDRMKRMVDETIRSLADSKFRVDPIGGERFSKQTSIVSSAYKRHGQILETAIRERLSDSEYFTVWDEPDFKTSNVADNAIRGRNSDIPEDGLIELPYGDPGRSIQIDAFVFDNRIKSVRSYEIKRANGHFDSGKKRSILRDTLCTQALLRSYASKRGLTCSITEARVICYYGIKALPDPLCLSAEELDDHFVFPVYQRVERVNQYFKEQLYLLIEAISNEVQLDFEGVCGHCPLKVSNASGALN